MRSAWKKYLIITVAITGPALLPASVRSGERPDGDIRVVSSDGSSTVVEFTPSYFTEGKSGRGEFLRIGFANSLSAEPVVPGSPDLPVRSVPLRLGSLSNTVDVLEASYADTSGVIPSPVPTVRDAGGVPVPSYAADPARYNRAGFFPPSPAALESVGEARGAVFGNLVFSPLSYDASSNTLRKYTRIVVRVTATGTSAGTGAVDPLNRRIGINQSEVMSRPPASGSLTPVRKGGVGAVPSVLREGPWLKLSMNSGGMVRLTGQYLRDAGIPATTDPRTIRIFGNGGGELPADPAAAVAADLTEVRRLVTDAGSPGVLDGPDEVVFYSAGARGWVYDSAGRKMSHVVNRYWETAYYFVTYGGAQGIDIQTVGSPPVADFTAYTAEGKLFREDEKQNILASGMMWFGQSFNSGDRITYAHPLPGIVPGSSIRYRLSVGARASSPSSFTFSDHGQQVGTSVVLASTQVGSYFYRQVIGQTVDRSTTVGWTDGQTLLGFFFSSQSPAGVGYLDWYEIFYDRLTTAHGDEFSFFAPDTTAVIDYHVDGFSGSAVRAFDVTDPANVTQFTTVNHSDTCSVRVTATAGDRRRVVIAGPAGYVAPSGFVPVANQDLRGDPAAAEYVIVAPPAFLGAARRLAEYRERPGEYALATKVVNTEEIYNEFGGGIPSPVAIRNYLKYLYETQSPPPSYVLLFGDGDYDYRRITTNGPQWLPPWETDESTMPLETYATDDNFVIFDGSSRIALSVGRLTAQSAAEAEAMVDKIIAYETAPVKDPWKLKVTFVADDGLAGIGEDDGFTHLRHAENVAALLPDLFEKTKIYLFEYPTEIAAAGRRKPAVNKAIRDAITRGTFVLNYSGHGNPRLWAHEAVFVREDDIPLVSNPGKYFILVAATCNYAAFDAINDQSGAELLAALPGDGAIATLSATRVVFAFQNLGMNNTFFSYLFDLDSLGRMTTRRLGDAMYRTKQVRTGTNDRKYFLLGDPALVPAFPRRPVMVDSVNGVPATQVVDLYALGRSSISASVQRDSTPGSFSGSARVSVYDADRLVTINDATAGSYPYRANGNILFRGDATVTADRLGATFIVPKDISYGTENGRISVYLWNASTDGAGATRNIRIAGTDSTAPADVTGPVMEIFIDSRSFRPGDPVSATPTLLVDIADSSGINTSGAGIGHRLEAWLDDQPESIDLSEYYRSNPDTYVEGVVSYPLGIRGSLAPGSHRIRVRAWDTYNNSSTGETVFSVGAGDGLRLMKVYNYPNPFRQSTWFTFEHNQTSPLDVEIKIYTVAGRVINSLTTQGVGDRFVKLPWDGRDREGDEVANGIYLYKVIARTVDGRYSGEALGKLSVSR